MPWLEILELRVLESVGAFGKDVGDTGGDGGCGASGGGASGGANGGGASGGGGADILTLLLVGYRYRTVRCPLILVLPDSPDLYLDRNINGN